MYTHTQKPRVLNADQGQQSSSHAESPTPTPTKQKLHSVFNLVKSCKGKPTVICTALTGEQATSLVIALANEVNSRLLVKFAGMKVSK